MAAAGTLYGPLRDARYKNVPHKVVHRDEERVLIEVDCVASNGTTIAGQRVEKGKQKLIVYESQLEAVKARVQTDEQKAKWDIAVEMYESDLKQKVAEKFGPDTASTDPKVVEARERFINSYGESSPSKEFGKFYRTGLPPFRSMRVIEKVPAPETEAMRALRLAGVAPMAGLAPAQDAEKEALLARLADLEAKLEKLTASKK